MTRLATFEGASSIPRLDFAVPFVEAIAWADERGVVLPGEFYGERLQSVRARAFTVSGLAAVDQVQQVADSLAQALAGGQSFREWQREVREAEPAVLGLPNGRLELIYRNAVQTAYGIGRTIQQRENVAVRPFLMWDAVNDDRTRPTHAAMDGHIAAMDDPVWQQWHPPAGHGCRCTRIALTEPQARARGYPQARPLVEPDAGWAGDPTEGNDDLVRVVLAKRDAMAAGGEPPIAADPGPASQFIDDALQQLTTGGRPVFLEQKTSKAAAEYAVKADLADFADYSGIKPEVANAFNASLFDHVREFPELRKNQRFIGSAQAQFSRFREIQVEKRFALLKAINPGVSDEVIRRAAEKQVKLPRVGAATWAHSWAQPDVGGVAVNRKFGADPETLKASLLRNEESKYHPIGANTIRSIADHEFGHQLDDLLGLHRDQEVLALYTEARAAGVREVVSGYAAKNIKEFIAEAWTESLNNPTPRKFAVAIANIIRSRYADKFPKP